MDLSRRAETQAASLQSGGPVDSRRYIFSFPISSVKEIPAGFDELAGCGEIHAGVFLPQDDPDWLGRRRYPPRILLITATGVVVAAHESAREPVWKLPICQVSSLEWGRVLLSGWIVFTGGRTSKRLPFNTRGIIPVERCIKVFKERWLPRVHGEERRPETFGAPLTLKFEYARAAELMDGEAPVLQFFHPAVRRERRILILRRVVWAGGDLIVVTGRRLFWITERCQGRYEPYGTVTSCAPLGGVREVRLAEVGARAGAQLQIVFESGLPWRIPAGEGLEAEAGRFAEALGRLL